MSDMPRAAWRQLPARCSVYGQLDAEPVPNLEGVYLAVDHDGSRHLILEVEDGGASIADQRSRGFGVLTRPLSVQGKPEHWFVDLFCAADGDHDVFDLVVSAILELLESGSHRVEAVRATVARWRRFWSAAPKDGLSPEQVRGLFGELWFLAVWLLPHGTEQVTHWLGPMGARHDFMWPSLAIEAKATASLRGHVHRINGLDQLEPPAPGRLLLFSLGLREEESASNSLVSLVEAINRELTSNTEAQDVFEERLIRAGYSPAASERYSDIHYRVVTERMYEVQGGFPRLTQASFVGGVPRGIERVEYEINLDECHEFLLAESPSTFVPPRDTHGAAT